VSVPSKPKFNPPLADLLVIDLTRALAGPYCTLMLADLGAKICKIEPIAEVDSTRGLPPFLGQNMSSYFAAINRNKLGLSLNLKTPKGVDLLKKLAAKADVIIDNFRPDTMKKFGLDYDQLRANVNPRLVSCSISGFGSTGDYRLRSSFDLVVQAMGGAMSITGEKGGNPVRLGLPMGDLAAGMYASTGILSALHARSITQLGRHVEISMLDGMVSLLSYMGAHYLNTGDVPGPQGSGHQVNVPYQAFNTQKGWIVIAIFGERFWKEVCDVLGIAHIYNDSRFQKAQGRSEHKDYLLGVIEPILMQRTAEQWLTELLALKVPCGPINTIDQVFADSVVQQRNMIVETNHNQYGVARSPGNPMKVDGIRDGVATAAPLPGENTTDILQSILSLNESQIRSLREEGVI